MLQRRARKRLQPIHRRDNIPLPGEKRNRGLAQVSKTSRSGRQTQHYTLEILSRRSWRDTHRQESSMNRRPDDDRHGTVQVPLHGTASMTIKSRQRLLEDQWRDESRPAETQMIVIGIQQLAFSHA